APGPRRPGRGREADLRPRAGRAHRPAGRPRRRDDAGGVGRLGRGEGALMARADLLALEPEDLAVLSNRGIVKRAQAELDSGDYTCEVREEDGAVSVKWSDDVECHIPAGKGLADGRCSCP